MMLTSTGRLYFTYNCETTVLTRMHSSRMCTVLSSSRLPGEGGEGEVVSAPVHAWICLPRGCLPQCMLGYTYPCEQNDRQV